MLRSILSLGSIHANDSRTGSHTSVGLDLKYGDNFQKVRHDNVTTDTRADFHLIVNVLSTTVGTGGRCFGVIRNHG
jgi:hypothetical protein